MAARDLSKRRTPLRARPQRTFRRETTMPRQGTDRPDRGVYTTIRRPSQDGARQLQNLLGLAEEVGQNIYGDIKEGQDQKNAASAVEDFLTGEQDDERFAKSRAYREAWQRESAKDLALTVSQGVTEAVNDRLNDDEDPATLEDIDEIIEGSFKASLYNEDGTPKVTTPEALQLVANALTKTKAGLMPKAAEVISDRQDLQVMELSLRNKMAEWESGSAIGDSYYDRDPLAPLPEGEEEAPQRAPMRTERRTIQIGQPTGRLPLKGAVTSTFKAHAKRGSAGVDIDGKMGDPIEAPAGGKVSVGRDGRSGLFVKIDHGNGVVSSYSHLSTTDLKDGDVVGPGQVLGLVGNSGNVSKKSGDGSHLHYRVKVNGKDVDPLSHQFGGGTREIAIATGGEPELATALPEDEAPRPGFPVEEWIRSLPPTINKGKAKAFIIDSLTARAVETGDASPLNGLEESTRKDGTPSFTPAERLQIVQTRDRIREKARIKAERAEKELQDANADSVLQAIMEGSLPDPEWIAAQSANGLLDERTAWGFQRHVEAERERAIREAEAVAAEAEREREERLDAAAEIEAIRCKVDGCNRNSILKRFTDGEFGLGKDAAQRASKLISAANQGAARRRETPHYAFWSEKLKEFKPKASKSGSGRWLQTNEAAQASEADYAAAMATFDGIVERGGSPADAYQKALTYLKTRGATASSSQANDRESYLIRKARGEVE